MLQDFHKDYVTKENKIPKDRKYLVKTEGNDKRMISVKKFGEKDDICNVGSEIGQIEYMESTSKVHTSIKLGNYLTCNIPLRVFRQGSKWESLSQMDFILDTKYKIFNFYNIILGSLKGESDRIGYVVSGKCEEI